MSQIKDKITRTNVMIYINEQSNYLRRNVYMLTEDEKKFITYWEEHRLKEKKVLKQWLIGLPAGFVIGIPLVINFFSGWYKRADMETRSGISNGSFNPLVLIIAVLLIISFMAIFSKRHTWEMNEQRFKELKSKE